MDKNNKKYFYPLIFCIYVLMFSRVWYCLPDGFCGLRSMVIWLFVIFIAFTLWPAISPYKMDACNGMKSLCCSRIVFFLCKSCLIYSFLLSLQHLSHRWCAERHIGKTPLIVVMGGVEDTKYRKGVYLALCSLTLRKRRKLWNYCQET